MLNRRLLRVKAFQAVYAVKQAEEVSLNLAGESIDEFFAPDLNSMVIPDKKLLHRQKTKGRQLLSDWYKTREIGESSDEEVKEALDIAINLFQDNFKKDAKNIRKNLSKDIEQILRNYTSCLSYPLVLAEYVDRYMDENANKKLIKNLSTDKLLRFKNNKVIAQLAADSEIRAAADKTRGLWMEEGYIGKMFKSELLKLEVFEEYISSEEESFELDKTLVLDIVKKLVFKSEILQQHFEEEDIQWVENREIVKGMCTKTLKGVEEGTTLELLEVSPNWEEDEEFFENLFDLSIKNNREQVAIIEKKLENWDLDRVALSDIIILNMALVELLHFTSIPVKVTINEYIELSKNYSTPKSKQFVNGILDTLSKELTEEGKIKKSGRGLIDNK